MNHIKRTLNAVTIIGRIAEDFAVALYGDDPAWSEIRLSTESVYKIGQERQEKTTIIPVRVYGPSAEYLDRNAKKGTRVLIVGSVGNTGNSIHVVAEHVQILSSFREYTEVANA